MDDIKSKAASDEHARSLEAAYQHKRDENKAALDDDVDELARQRLPSAADETVEDAVVLDELHRSIAESRALTGRAEDAILDSKDVLARAEKALKPR